MQGSNSGVDQPAKSSDSGVAILIALATESRAGSGASADVRCGARTLHLGRRGAGRYRGGQDAHPTHAESRRYTSAGETPAATLAGKMPVLPGAEPGRPRGMNAAARGLYRRGLVRIRQRHQRQVVGVLARTEMLADEGEQGLQHGVRVLLGQAGQCLRDRRDPQ